MTHPTITRDQLRTAVATLLHTLGIDVPDTITGVDLDPDNVAVHWLDPDDPYVTHSVLLEVAAR